MKSKSGIGVSNPKEFKSWKEIRLMMEKEPKWSEVVQEALPLNDRPIPCEIVPREEYKGFDEAEEQEFHETRPVVDTESVD
jgi:hypothetical protein